MLTSFSNAVICRWNGASDIDFPMLQKVDHQNSSDISEKVINAVANYPAIIASDYDKTHSPNIFMAYVISMWRRARFTTDVYFGSSFLHFIIAPQTLEEEILANFQVLSIFSMFPLASIDLFVFDPLWYIRHHYNFFSLLKNAGYIRHDPLDTFDDVSKESVSKSYFRIRDLGKLKLFLSSNQAGFTGFRLLPSWNPISVALTVGVCFNFPNALLPVLENPSDSFIVRFSLEEDNLSHHRGNVEISNHTSLIRLLHFHRSRF